jgi:hypothetical protein
MEKVNWRKNPPNGIKVVSGARNSSELQKREPQKIRGGDHLIGEQTY